MDDDDGDQLQDPGDVFRIPDLWVPSKWMNLVPEAGGLFFEPAKFSDTSIELPGIAESDSFFSTQIFSFEALPDPSPPSISANSEHGTAEGEDKESPEAEDIWLAAEEKPLVAKVYHSWTNFENPEIQEPNSAYITEAGPSVFDAAIAAPEDYLRISNSEHVVVDAKVYMSSLHALGLGRSSAFFDWDKDKQTFRPTLAKMRISGFSGEILDALSTTFLECGNITKFLQKFVDRTYSQNRSPSQIALANAVSTLLLTTQSRLSVSALSCTSILQLQTLFKPAHSILTCFQRLVKNVSSTRNDEAMLSTIFQEIQVLEHRTDSLRNVLLEILSRVSQPWLEFSGEWLGLQRELGLPLTTEGRGRSFVKVVNIDWVNEQGVEFQKPDFLLDYDRVPSFIAPEDARSMFEVGKSLRFMKTHHPEHPLSKVDIVASSNPPLLNWQFSWQEIVQLESKAFQYEKDLVAAIRRYSEIESTNDLPLEISAGLQAHELDLFGRPAEEMEAHILASISSFDQPPQQRTPQDRLSVRLNTYLDSRCDTTVGEDSTFAPPISLAPLLSFNPIISAQARIVNGACMRIFFNSHNLREHFSIQREFHLFGNGVFASRLSHALFDPELESAERHRGVARSGGTMGLRLGDRDTWPPASSELRLALMGVLTDSYIPRKHIDKSRTGTFLDQTSLPGDLSFAVRNMSEDEIEKCMDADSNEALDFLRLSYKPPSPLDAVITTLIIYKYDQLFRLLLRVIRMLYVVSALFQDVTDRTSSWRKVERVAQRFRAESQHFILSVARYFFETGVESTWRTFERKLDQVEKRISMDGDDYALGPDEGLDRLRDYHERVLDKIMFVLLLRKRQQPVMNLLEEIFALILKFSKYSRKRALGGDDSKVDLKELYLSFRKKVGLFITVCRGLREKKGYGEKRTSNLKSSGQESLFDGEDLVEENTISQLLATLEMTDYYSKDVNL